MVSLGFDRNAILVAETTDYYHVINCLHVYQICRSRAAWKEISDSLKIESDDKPFWENWIGNPDVVELDWKTSAPHILDALAENEAASICNAFYPSYTTSTVINTINKLQGMVSQTQSFQEKFRKMMSEVENQNRKNLDSSLSAVEASIATLKKTRNLSATLLVGIATIPFGLLAGLGGGTIATSVAAGSVLTGVAQFQDNTVDHKGNALSTGRRLSAAAMEASGTFVFSLVGGSKKIIPGLQDTAMLVIKASWKGATALVAGKDLRDASIKGALVFSDKAIDNFIKTPPMEKLLSAYAVPAGLKIFKEDERIEVIKETTNVATKATLKMIGEAVVEKIKSSASDRIREQITSNARGSVSGIVNSAIYSVRK